MANRRSQLSVSRSKETSRRLKTAVIGSHMPRRPSRRMNAGSVNFSSARRKRRVTRGFVKTIPLSGASAGGPPDRSQRVRYQRYSRDLQRKSSMHRLFIAVACVVAIGAVAFCAGSSVLFGSLDKKLAFENSNVSEALVAASLEDGSFYAVIAANLDTADSSYIQASGSQKTSDVFALVRVDKSAGKVSVLSVPPNIEVSSGDGKIHVLGNVDTVDGDAGVVNAISNLADVDVSHYVEIDAEDIVGLVDKLGGITINLPEEIDDPSAGNIYLPAGKQTLDGASVLVALRAGNYESGVERQAEVQRDVLSKIAAATLKSNSVGFLFQLDKMAEFFNTDMDSRDAFDLVKAFKKTDKVAFEGVLLPGYESTTDEDSAYTVSKDELTSMMEAMDSGQDFAVVEASATVDPDSFTVTVLNGGGVDGAASQIAKVLSADGFKVEDTGNTDTSVYTETLVVFHAEDKKAAAQTVVNALGMGRVVSDETGFYDFNTDVLVVLGKDWKPTV